MSIILRPHSIYSQWNNRRVEASKVSKYVPIFDLFTTVDYKVVLRNLNGSNFVVFLVFTQFVISGFELEKFKDNFIDFTIVKELSQDVLEKGTADNSSLSVYIPHGIWKTHIRIHWFLA